MRDILRYKKDFSLSIAVVLSAISCILLVLWHDSVIISFLNVLISFILLLFPESYIPLILCSSISRSISIFGFSATYYYLAMLFCFASAKSGFCYHKNCGKSWIFLLAFTFWLLISACFSATGAMALPIRIFTMIVLCRLCAASKTIGINESFYFIKKTAPFILIAILAKLVISPVPYIVEGHYSSISLTTIHPDINPNQIAQFIAVILFFSVAVSSSKPKILPIAYIVISTIILFILKSRASLYAALAISAFYYLFVSRRIKFGYKVVISCFAVMFVAAQFLAVVQFDPETATSYGEGKEMSISSLVESGGSGRIFTWEEVITNIIPMHPVFGIGIGTENYNALGLEHDCDNLYMDLITGTGFIGFILFFLFFLKTVLEINQGNGTTGTIVKYLLYMILCFGIGETLFDSFFMWSIVFLCYIYMFSNNQLYQYGKTY